MNEKITKDEKQEWTTPALSKMDIAEITKSGPNLDANEDPFNNFYGPAS